MNYIGDLLREFWGQHQLLIVVAILMNLLLFPIELIGISNISNNLSILLSQGIDQNFHLIRQTLLMLLGIFVFYSLVNFIEEYSDTRSIPSFEQFMRDKIIDPAFDEQANNLDHLETARLLHNLQKTPKVLSDIYERFNRYLIPFVILILSLICYFFYCHWILGIVAIICFIIYWNIFQHLSTKQINISKIRENHEINFNNQLEDTINNLFLVSVANNNQAERERINRETAKFNEIYTKEMSSCCQSKLTKDLMAIAVTGILGMTVLSLYQQGKIDPATVVLAFSGVMLMTRQFYFYARRVSECMIEIGSLQGSNNYLQQMKKNVSSNTNNPRNRDCISSGEIKFHDLTFQYPETKQPIIENLNYTKPANSSLTIRGSSGSGKSTLVKLLNGFLQPTSGQIFIDGVDLATIDKSYERQVVSYLPQNTRLFNRTILENMLYGTPYHHQPMEGREKVIELMAELGISELFTKVNLNHLAGKHGDKLSGGQRQAVHLIRIYLQTPKIIIFDEPTTGLDHEHLILVQEAIKKLAQRTNVILITHDPDFTVGETLHLTPTSSSKQKKMPIYQPQPLPYSRWSTMWSYFTPSID